MTTLVNWIAFESLPRRQRQVLALHDVNLLNCDRIGEQIGVSAAQARIELRQARLAICQRLAQERQSAA